MEEHQELIAKKYRKTIAITVVALLCFFTAGIYIGYANRPWIDKVTGVKNQENSKILGTADADFDSFWKVWTLIDEKYPSAKDVTSQDRIWGAIKGLVSSLEDPYSQFFDPEEAQEFAEEISGSFSGIGVEIGVKDKILTVISPLKDSPGEKAGLKPGDKILKIGDVVATGLTTDEAIKYIRGPEGTAVTLTILSEGTSEPKEVEIIRATIQIPTIDSQTKNGVYVISLYQFNANATTLMRKEFQNFKKTGLKKLVLDMRGNPGGYLDSAVDITSEFLPAGAVIVSEDFGGKQDPEIYRSKGSLMIPKDVSVVVLIDGGSASASEILAGALGENQRATIIGTKSFGKGSVQELVPVTDDTAVKITIAKWLTPNGNSISQKGITPHIEVSLTKDDIENKRDPQLDRAIEFLNTGK